MKQVLVIALLMFPIVALGANKGVRPYRGPAHVLEIPNPVVVNDTISIRLKVEVRECVDEIEIRYYDWQGSLVISRQQTREMDTATFHMRVRVPTSRRADFKAYVIERALEGETPCARENTVTETDGSVTVRLEDIKPGDQSFKFPVPLKRAGDSVRLIELIPVYDNTGKTKPDSSTPPRPMEIQYDRIAPQIIEDSGGSSSIDSQQVAPKDTARKPAFVPRSEWTEEEKRQTDSLIHRLMGQQERGRMAKLEETPYVGVGSEFMEVGGGIYMRKPGERKFRPAGAIKALDFDMWAQRCRDSAAARPPETELEFRLWLSNSEDLKYARTLIDSLIPTDDADCFRTRTSVKVIHLLEKRGIKTAPIAKMFRGRQTSPSAP